jgi:hypothetical protein
MLYNQTWQSDVLLEAWSACTLEACVLQPPWAISSGSL